MAIAIYNDFELEKIARLTPNGITKLMAGKSVKWAMAFRRNVQISLSAYTLRNKGKVEKKHGWDSVQAGCMWVVRMMEKEIRRCYIAHHFKALGKKYIAGDPEMGRIKTRLSDEAEKFIRKESF